MTKKRAIKIIERLRDYYGDPKPDLKYTDLYELTISVVLSAQTTDKQVNSVTTGLFKKFPDFKSLSQATIHEIESLIRKVGLYHTKARNISNLSKTISEKFNGKIPDVLENLIKLPGIGRKSANVILSIGFNKPAIAVDTHILRIANRIGFIKSDNPYKVEQALMHYLPQSYWKITHLLLIRHGRVLCKARNPLHEECPIYSLCDEVNKNL